MRRGSMRLALCLLLGAVVACQGALEVKTWFPDNPSLEFFAGKVGPAIIGARNPTSTSVNITAAYGQLAMVNNPDGAIYNFSAMGYQLPQLNPGEETIVEYGIGLPENMPPRDFILRLYLWVNAGEEYDGVLAFNETISVIEEAKLLDTELLGLYAILLALLAAAAYGLLNLAQNKGWVKKARKSKPVAVTGTSDKSEWLKGTVADKALKKKT